jgi:hypothetical protein
MPLIEGYKAHVLRPRPKTAAAAGAIIRGIEDKRE